MAAFPSALASFTGFTSGHTLAADSHAAQHNLEQGEIVAVQTKVGTGSSTPTNATFLRGNGAGTSAWAQVTLTSDVTGVLPIANGGTGQNSLTGLPLVSPTISGTVAGGASYTSPSITGTVGGGATYSSPVLTTPTIGSFTNAQHDHSNAAGGGNLNGANAITDGTLTPAELVSGSGTSWVWQSWTPVWTNLTVGNATVTAYYTQIGKTVFYRLSITLGTTSSVGNGPFFTLPVTASADATQNTSPGLARMDDAANTGYVGQVILASTTTAQFSVFDSASTYVRNSGVTATAPFAFGTSDSLYVQHFYEAA